MIEELRTLAGKATPGPWDARKDRTVAADGVPLFRCYADRNETANAALIVALVNNLPAILTALTAASKLEVAKEALRKSQQGWENVVEMGILPPRHWETANNLSNDCLQALAALEAK
jgi:hypothetical protein